MSFLLPKPLPTALAALLAVLLSGLPTLPAAAQEAAPAAAATPFKVEGASVEGASIETELRQRAEAQFQLGDVAGALSTHGVLESALTGTRRAAARDSLWRALNALPPTTDFSTVSDPVALGWVQLLELARSGAGLAAFEAWRQRHIDHPGESQIAAGLVTPTATGSAAVTSGAPVAAMPTIRSIALLLPTTGPFAAAARSIQAGAEAARNRGGADAPPVTLIDTTAGLEAAVAQAETLGALALVGPLRKEEVTALTSRSTTLPTVTLNYLDAGRIAPSGITLFGLAPEDEAHAAAEHAAGQSLLRAVVLAQEGDWGSRAAAAFKARFEQRGGTVLTTESYAIKTTDFAGQLKRVLGIAPSEARGSALIGAGVKAELQAVPRGDIDVVFLAARSPQAKLIWPQMRYLRAGRIATYAPAAAADGGSRDLHQLRVCDMPWRNASTGPMAALRGELASLNPRAADTQRFFALGYDAYELARRRVAGALAPGESTPGLTGELVLDADGGVRRRLDCVAQYSPRDAGAIDLAEP